VRLASFREYPAVIGGSTSGAPAENDREMRCTHCGARAFSYDAPRLVADGVSCLRCGSGVRLVPNAPRPHFFEYPTVRPLESAAE
jgi:hypothetical protein